MALPVRPTLSTVLAHVNEARRSKGSARRASLVAAVILLSGQPARASIEQLEERVDRALGRPSRRLAVYGSLRRDQPNHGELSDLGGRWGAGFVRGRFEASSPAADGHATLAPDARAEPCGVEVLESVALPDAWARLDAFEGLHYRRELVPVEGEGGSLRVANLYVPAREASG